MAIDTGNPFGMVFILQAPGIYPAKDFFLIAVIQLDHLGDLVVLPDVIFLHPVNEVRSIFQLTNENILAHAIGVADTVKEKTPSLPMKLVYIRHPFEYRVRDKVASVPVELRGSQ